MQRPIVIMFYQRYFAAIQSLSGKWLAYLTPERRLRMLEELMQWEITCPAKDKE